MLPLNSIDPSYYQNACTPWSSRCSLAYCSFNSRDVSLGCMTWDCVPMREMCTQRLLLTGERYQKLALAVPTLSIPTSSTGVKSALLGAPISPSRISPTVRNTRLNQASSFSYSQAPNTKSILKKGHSSRSTSGKKLSFSEELAVRSIEPLPQDCYGEYVKLSKDERRWGRGN